MAVLPNSRISMQQPMEFREQPSLTWKADSKTGRIQGMADGLEAVTQTVEVILQTERFLWQIYHPDFGMQWKGLIGQDPGYVASELRRRIQDAFSIDSRIVGIEKFSCEAKGDAMTVDLTVSTVYGPVSQKVEVNLRV